MNDLLTLNRMARGVGVTQQWLRDQAETGKIPCLKADNRYLFNPSSVVEALAEKASQTRQEATMDAKRIPVETQSVVLLLNPKRTAKALSISPRKLWGMTASGEIPHVRLGRCVRYAVDDLLRWITRQKGGK